MDRFIESVIQSDAFGITIFVFAFLCGATLFYLSYSFLVPSFDIRRRIGSADPIGREAIRLVSAGESGVQNRVRQAIETYYRSLEEKKETSYRRRLVRAGFFGEGAVRALPLIRYGGAALLFFGVVIVIPQFAPGLLFARLVLFGLGGAALLLIVPNFVLDSMGKRQEEQYRRGFPDFMDMMIMCADAGLSLEAAVARVAEEFLTTHKGLGIHLNIMMLEVRAGKRLRDALQSFADRLDIEEARSLSILFRQSEELGASITQTLRVFSTEMRQLRIIRAEEKANTLAVKMLLPLGVFMFPVMLAVVILSPMLSLMKTLSLSVPH